MYVYGDDGECNRKITFELPVDWRGNSSVMTNDEDWIYTMKVDMCGIGSATRESALKEYNSAMEYLTEAGNLPEIIAKSIYKTDKYEVLYYKKGPDYPALSIHAYSA